MVAEFGDTEHVVDLDRVTLAAVELQLAHHIVFENVAAGGLRHGALTAIGAHVLYLLVCGRRTRRRGERKSPRCALPGTRFGLRTCLAAARGRPQGSLVPAHP